MTTFYEIIVHMPDYEDSYGGPMNYTRTPMNYKLYGFFDVPKVSEEELIDKIEKGYTMLTLVSRKEGFNQKVTQTFKTVKELFDAVNPQKKLEELEKKRMKLDEEIVEIKKNNKIIKL